MNTIPFEYLKKPALWQRSAGPFWDDDHISKQMLMAHLNPDTDAASRKRETIDDSVKWLSGFCAPGARIMDLGCGPGLYTKRLSDMGYRVTGMDISRRSIAYAKEHDAKTRYILGSYLNMDICREFDLITLIYCDYAALTPPERAALLANARRALRSGGKFIFDVFTRAHFERKSERATWHVCENGGFWSEKPHICLEATYLYNDDAVSADRAAIVTEGGIADYIIWDTAYTQQQLARELLVAGFEVCGAYGDACGKGYAVESDTLCAVATPQTSTM